MTLKVNGIGVYDPKASYAMPGDTIGPLQKSSYPAAVAANTPFFSAQGQEARLINVKDTVIAAFTNKGVSSNTGIPVVDKVLSYAASNPLTTAAVVTPINTFGAGKAAISALPTAGKVALAIGAPVAAGFAISDPEATGNAIAYAGTVPSQLTGLGAGLGSAYKDKSLTEAGKAIKDNPVAAGIVGAAGAVAAGIGAAGIASYLATKENTSAVKKNTAASLQSQGISALPSDNTPMGSSSDLKPAGFLNSNSGSSAVAALPGNNTVKRKYRRYTKPKSSGNVSVRVYNNIVGRYINR